MLITITVTKAFERISLDVVGSLPVIELGNTHILTMQDELTRYALAVALASTGATTVSRALVECCVCIFGIPTSILTDCGTNFLSGVFKAMCKLLDKDKSKTTPWHPQTNGYLERSDDKDEFETVAKETLDKIIEILEQDEINNTGSELIDSVELDKLVEELDTFDEEIFNDKVENKPISSDVLNKSLRLINLDEFENSPTTNATRQGLRRGSEMKPLNAIEAIKLIPDYSGQTEIYPFLNACEDDIIEPSFSPWNAPLLLVKKKLDASQIPKFRIVVDFRALNKVTINEYHPLPNITEILDQLGQCNLFSITDLASGFYQIKLNEKSKELTAFSTNQGHWHFKKMAMGLKTSPCSFQKLMNNVMAGIVGIKCLVYLDDIIIYGKGLLNHNEKLRDVFERLRNHNLKIQPTKCEFLKQQCMYLDHIISENGIQPDPEKVKSVLQFSTPTSVKEIKSFLGLSGYYRKFIKSYSLISKPMTNLLRKDVTFNWDTSCQEAFDKLKNILLSEPILQYPDFTKPFIVTTDASGKALGTILSQGEVSQDLPIAYASRTLSKCERLKEDVIEYIKNCESCQKGKVPNKKVKQPMLITLTISEPFEKIFLDIVGPIVTTLSGNTYILTLQDDLTKYLMGIALPNHQANTIAEAFVTHFVCTHGIPQTILTDQGTDFLSKIFTEMALAQTKPYRISRLTQENGMYFENQGPLRLTNSDWKLLIYVKLDNFNQRTKDTMDFYKRTLIICNDLTIAYEGMFKTTCDNFKLTSNSLEREVSRKRFYMLQSIDETDTVTREKRGLVNLVGRVQKTLFGTLDDTDAELYDRQIEKLQSSQQNLLKIIDKQTSILKATANTFKEANKMEAQINSNGIKFIIVDFEFTMINRKDLLLISGSISSSLNKYKPVKLEGKPIVLTTTNKLKMLQNREVKKVMQSVGRIFRNKPELLLPLMGQLEASLKLKGETTLSTTYINQYLHTDKRIPVIVFWNGTTDKEILQKLGLNRKMLNITSYKSTNTWLYESVSENVAIKCDNEDPHNIILNGTGQLTLNPQCVLYAKQTILFPSQTIVRNSSQNLYNPIQSEGLGSLSVTNISQDLFESLNFSESHYSIGLEDLSRHSKSLKEIEELIKVEKKYKLCSKGK
ncbi:hypothetical protein QTP88_001933 [Uroleucon formosanum]